MRNHKRERGNSIVEFTLAGIPVIFLIYSTIQLSTAMWNYHTLAHAVNEGAHYAAVRGQGCTTNGNSCGTTLGTLARQIASAAVGIPADQVIARRLAYALLEAEDRKRIRLVQFHQSYAYEDFIEGYRPENGGFALRKGLFREFCETAAGDTARDYVLVIDEIMRALTSTAL